VSKIKIVVSPKFKSSLTKITSSLSQKRKIQLADAIDNLKTNLKLFPESYPVAEFDRFVEIPFRKAVISKDYIVVYFFQHEKIYFVDIFHTAQDWKRKLFH